MKTKHTPGPWFACCTERTPHFVFSESSEKTICGICNNDPKDSKYELLEKVLTIEEARANAKLIAAAPELLEALQNAINFIRCCPELAKDERRPKGLERFMA